MYLVLCNVFVWLQCWASETGWRQIPPLLSLEECAESSLIRQQFVILMFDKITCETIFA